MTHDYHPHVWAPEAGVTTGPVLADGCVRCEEIAQAPVAHLDATRQCELLRRFDSGEWQQSQADLAAAFWLASSRKAVRG